MKNSYKKEKTIEKGLEKNLKKYKSLKIFLDEYFKDPKKYWYYMPLYPYIYSWYKSLFGTTQWIRAFFSFITYAITCFTIYVIHIIIKSF